MIRNGRPPKKFEEIRISGEVIDVKEKEWFSFETKLKQRELRNKGEQLRPRVQTIYKKEDNYFQNPSKLTHIRAVYLNKESEQGLYKNPENNLPYEIWGQGDFLLYRQSIVEKKEDIFNRLEKLAVDEGLRK